MDNRIFNVNGIGLDRLISTLELAFSQEDYSCTSWTFSKDHGLIFHWCAQKGHNTFPVDISAEEAARVAWSWLTTDQAGEVEKTEWDIDLDHYGHNSDGWRVFCEDWGHVAGQSSAICAVRPVHAWHGK